MDEKHAPDPIFEEFTLFEGVVPAGFRPEFTGALVSTSFTGNDDPTTQKERYAKTNYPSPSETMLEYLSILKSIKTAHETFIMVELGAGYGRWIVTAAKAIQQNKSKTGLSYFLIGVEADPTHFSMMKEHFRNNEISTESNRLIQAAVTERDGEIWFTTGSPNEWWGQAIVKNPEHVGNQYPDQKNIQVKAVSLETILRPLSSVDLLDLDVQGEEFKVLSSGSNLLGEKVKRLHIGTHNHEIEENLRKLLRGLGWICEEDFPCHSTQDTVYGRIGFVDGVQAWVKSKTI